MMIGLVLSSCKVSQNDPEVIVTPFEVESDSTVASVSIRRAPAKAEPGFNIPDENGNYHVYFFIRIDGKIQPEYSLNAPSYEYFPRTSAKKTMICGLNMGYVKSDFDWWSNMKFSKYVYASDGKLVQSVIVKEPTLAELVEASEYKGDSALFAPYVEHADELHFLWYACKKQDADGCWHIDGILTKNTVNDVKETSYGDEITKNYGFGGEIEADIHQQEHKDWNEIKTSVHLRDTVEAEVFLPIAYEYQMMSDDFDIRVGDTYTYVQETVNSKIEIEGIEYTIVTTIVHKQNGIYITIKPNKQALEAARRVYSDGITYEIHSYIKSEADTELIWNMLKQSTVKANTHVYGQIHSAYHVDPETGEELDVVSLPNL